MGLPIRERHMLAPWETPRPLKRNTSKSTGLCMQMPVRISCVVFPSTWKIRGAEIYVVPFESSCICGTYTELPSERVIPYLQISITQFL